VTDFLAETPSVARLYCPGCEPEADPTAEILDVRWCELHAPVRDGADDAGVTVGAFLSGSAEAGGEDNRRWCEIFHGPGRRAGPLPPAPGPARRRRRRL
jgi:hypothetical protein